MRALTTMEALMSSQIVLPTERLITHCTGIRALTTMDALMSYQFVLLLE
jgi:hypothetical protein